MKIFARQKILLLFLAVSVLSGCQTSDFASYEKIDGISKIGEDADLQLPIRTWEPEDTSASRAVVILHGCGGWHGGNIDLWARWFKDREYVAVAVDSFSPRGVRTNCDSYEVNQRLRAGDAYSALKYVVEAYKIESDKVIIIGFSDGGRAAIAAIMDTIWDYYADETLYVPSYKFAGAVAFYPPCQWMPRFSWVTSLHAPVQIVSGSADDWTPAASCQTWAAKLKASIPPTNVHVIRGATHAFDQFTWRSRRVGSRTHLGYRLTPSRGATQEAKMVVRKFLQNVEASE
jgi:dienelactone hydrolase